jgi:type III secretory pathway lipoprotein EscJ
MKNLIKSLRNALYLLLALVLCVGCGKTYKRDVLFELHQEQYNKVLYYAGKVVQVYPNVDSVTIYIDSVHMAAYAQDVLGRAWDNAR